jgi:hypothetical protein
VTARARACVQQARPQQPHAWECGPAGAGQAQAVGRTCLLTYCRGTQSFWMGVHFQFATNHRGSGGPLSKCSVLTATVRYTYARNGRGPPKTSWRSGSRTAVRRLSTPDVLVDVLLTALRYLGPQERWVPGRAVSMHRCYKAVMPLNDQQEHVYTSART